MNEDYYHSDEWKRVRELRLNYDNYQCRNCGSTKNLQVHHKRYTPHGRENIIDDLITECDECHHKITQLSRNKRRYRPYYRYKEGNTFWW